jgi:NAD-dependent dihydropyrimidine dehydrogenase PreA subunit
MESEIGFEYAIRLTARQIYDYLKSVGCTLPCEACGHDDFRVETNDDRVAFVTQELYENPAMGVVLVPLTCHRCGNTRLINAMPMAKAVFADHTGDDDGK